MSPLLKQFRSRLLSLLVLVFIGFAAFGWMTVWPPLGLIYFILFAPSAIIWAWRRDGAA